MDGAAESAGDAVATEAATACFHCGEPVPGDMDFSITLNGQRRPMCCPGCRAVATLIADSGLGAFYRQRTRYSERPAEDSRGEVARFHVYDDPQLLQRFSQRDDSGQLQLRLLVGGMTCAACTWLIEKSLHRLPGVSAVSVNLGRQRLDITLSPQALAVSEVFAEISRLGYRVQPWRASDLQEEWRSQYRQDLRRLAVAGIGMMQVGMFAIALHAGDLQGISDDHRGLMRWSSLAITSIVVLFSARGFFASAWQHLRVGALVMDTPVALAIGLAWAFSAAATVTGSGEVYYDSVVMFTFLLLLARFVEKRARQRDLRLWDDAESLLPDAVQRWDGRGWQLTPRVELRGGDRLLLRGGETVPIDATVARGSSAVREERFSGEALPRRVAPGDTVFAGTINLEGSLEITTLGSFAETRLAALQAAIDRAQLSKPALARLADRIAGRFVAVVLAITALTAALWWQIDADRALWVSLSVLVISCPCALSLATPAALASAAATLRRRGIVVYGEAALETLPRCDHVVFDKTGTLTTGALRLLRVEGLDAAWPRDRILAVAAALQRHSTHPAASAFQHLEPAAVSDVIYHPGQGLSGSCDRLALRLGSLAFCRALCPQLPSPPDDDLYWVALCSDAQPVAWLGLGDEPRPEAGVVLQKLRQQGCTLELLTGDSSGRARQLGEALGFEHIRSAQSPQDKMDRVAALQREGHRVLMIGDGLNDAPVLKLADASVAVAGAADLARAQADVVLLRGDLQALTRLLAVARRTRRTVLQNFAWALGYNLVGIPLAALGWVPPWAAAVGMSLSSLLVVGNSMRLRAATEAG